MVALSLSSVQDLLTWWLYPVTLDTIEEQRIVPEDKNKNTNLKIYSHPFGTLSKKAEATQPSQTLAQHNDNKFNNNNNFDNNNNNNNNKKKKKKKKIYYVLISRGSHIQHI